LNADDNGQWGREVTGPGGLTTFDGGPTSWQAVIEPPEEAPYGSTVQSETLKDHREFYFEMSDFQHAYERQEPADYVGADEYGKPKLTNIVQPDPFNAAEAYAPDIQDAWQQAVNPTLKLMHNGGFPAVVSAHGACPGGGVQNERSQRAAALRRGDQRRPQLDLGDQLPQRAGGLPRVRPGPRGA
jgi:hypothetical protein